MLCNLKCLFRSSDQNMNFLRDLRSLYEGWTVIRFWGNDIKKSINECVKVLEETIFDIRMNDYDLKDSE